ncbi:MAG: formylglycine-generating enzyme family protein [Phycisphaerae bacterium]|nr:formylglycine-generating enzyme family protein [Phycisphaerae bacterium]
MARSASQRWVGLAAVPPLAAIVLGAPCGPPDPPGERLAVEIPEAAFRFELVRVPASADGAVKPFYMSRHEITWEAFDVYIYGLDEEKSRTPAVDAVTRPTKPYLPPDRGFGHEGYAAISVGAASAKGFCAWLSARTGRKYRLATEAEWEHAARAGSATGIPEGATLTDVAVFKENSGMRPAPVGSKRPNAWGLHDMLGNVQEWVVGADGEPITKGGSYRHAAEALRPGAREAQAEWWNASDPQIPKSRWWLSDGPFVGFRVVMEPPDAPASANPEPKEQP